VTIPTEEPGVTMTDSTNAEPALVLVTDIVSSYVSKNSLPSNELPALIQSVYAAIVNAEPARIATEPPVSPTKQPPAVAIKKSMTDDFIICLEDGEKFRSMKRHLMTKFQMTPDQYREKWGLSKNYPMVAPNYSSARSAMAKAAGLGAKGDKTKKKADN
jgi:predicted transcriptional regulator